MRATILLAAAMFSCHPPQSPRPQPLPPPAGSAEPAAPVTEAEPTLDNLRPGAKVRGFTAVARYLDAAGKPMGARFVHDATGFTFDYLRIESAPQGYIWVNSFPTSDKGEPHTQEHLLLGKGDRGRRLGSFEAMALATSSAFTAQWRTAYHFNTVAGHDEFWPVFEDQLDALLHPDYTDEEIRREVRNFGVDKDSDGKLHLDEKGTVYNEMVRTYESPDSVLWRELGQLIYGPKHPLAFESGGYPATIRTMTPADIRTFHDAAYHLPNMGMIGAFPAEMSLASVLDHTAAILMKEEPHPAGKAMSEADLPRPAPAPAGTIQVVDYPYGDATNPGPLVLGWPASRALDPAQRTLLALFLDAVAGDESTPLYKQLVDGKTRVIDLGASGVFSLVSTDQGEPAYVGLSGVKADKLDPATIQKVRELVVAELKRIAQLAPNDPELVALNARVQSRVVDLRRRLAKLLDTPPGFGFRTTSSIWSDHLLDLSRLPGFDKSLTMAPALTQIDELLASSAGKNVWADRLGAWGLLAEPYGVAARPSPQLRAQLDAERKQRIDGELAALEQKYATQDPQAALAAYAKDYAARTQQLEASAKAVELPPLVASPPMTLDDGLKYETGEVAGVRSLAATFDTMASARVSLAFDVVGAAAPDDQFLLA
ncbi:MAG: M16 family metallopeptidase, partial [Acidobacteriota bacterium]